MNKSYSISFVISVLLHLSIIAAFILLNKKQIQELPETTPKSVDKIEAAIIKTASLVKMEDIENQKLRIKEHQKQALLAKEQQQQEELLYKKKIADLHNQLIKEENTIKQKKADYKSLEQKYKKQIAELVQKKDITNKQTEAQKQENEKLNAIKKKTKNEIERLRQYVQNETNKINEIKKKN